ncbi:MAG TPA: HNH endonuclease signature motif containing protein [Candidatus Dormibacteraeota bacterium]|nr:HNH endonuclease signature motif containing protein [Candidatus Dormibacteraeota bacterium]
MRSETHRLKVSAGARRVALRRSGGACEGCGLEWPWTLYLFRIDDVLAAAASNLTVLCPSCSSGRVGPFAPLVLEPTLRERLRGANNRRTGAVSLTPARRKRLVAARGSRCEICAVPAGERQLDVHHRLGILRGGDDDEANLMVLCFVCHHHLQQCGTGCGRWARKPASICRHCETRHRLERRYPNATWDEIKARFPALMAGWPPGYEPRPVSR